MVIPALPWAAWMHPWCVLWYSLMWKSNSHTASQSWAAIKHRPDFSIQSFLPNANSPIPASELPAARSSLNHCKWTPRNGMLLVSCRDAGGAVCPRWSPLVPVQRGEARLGEADELAAHHHVPLLRPLRGGRCLHLHLPGGAAGSGSPYAGHGRVRWRFVEGAALLGEGYWAPSQRRAKICLTEIWFQMPLEIGHIVGDILWHAGMEWDEKYSHG